MWCLLLPFPKKGFPKAMFSQKAKGVSPQDHEHKKWLLGLSITPSLTPNSKYEING